jgi:hypothetical protein
MSIQPHLMFAVSVISVRTLCTTANNGSSSSNIILGHCVCAVPFRFKRYSICATPRVVLINCLFLSAIMTLMNRERMSWVLSIVCQLCIHSYTDVSKITVSWDRTLCSLVDIFQRFGGTCWLHLQGSSLTSSTLNIEAVNSSETLIDIYQTARWLWVV